MPTLALRIDGMTCRHCVREVTSRLRDVIGVDTVTADAGTSVVRLSGAMGVDDVVGALRDLSYPVQVLAEAAEPLGPPGPPGLISRGRQRRDSGTTVAMSRIPDVNQ